MADPYVVIMAGGRGERFWPQSRLKQPKHLLPIVGDEPMLAQTVTRLSGLVPPERIFILTNAEQRAGVMACCPEIPPEQVVGEPANRDTAPAVGLATLLVQRADPEAPFAMLPADAVIHDASGFRTILGAAFQTASEHDALVTIGIRPDFPATGYGYLHRGAKIGEAAGREVFQVERFVEKPDEPTARGYVDSGEYYWNAGMFIWRSAVIGGEMAQHAPQLWEGLQQIGRDLDAGRGLEDTLAERYPALEKISIDFAVMEKAGQVVCLESAFDWDDVGAWPAVARHYQPDEAGNVVRGGAALQDANGNIVINEGGHLTALIGVSDLIVVQTGDATLVCPKDRAQDIKKLVKSIGADPQWVDRV